MLALQIISMKSFMQHLLISADFNLFLLEEATISTENTYIINGRRNLDFFSKEEQESSDFCPYEFTPWSDIKGLFFQLIKGKRPPLSFKFVLHLKPEQTKQLLQKENCSVSLEQIKAFVLTIKYNGEKAILTTGVSYYTFLMTKEPEAIWEKALSQYLSKKEIAFDSIS